ncbi:hypothetical protein N7508_003624 [Penicillium antarcticum]|uniref:uncharacterized protein n=1 Tax=Penicillium antarcticum TaxID=416450 RepID=UPI0023936F00|nr:uncharacterized protein N7508_003624 [Penicillium antarcticum]KAJ5312794.1 hypothetical protein N7508_003624 [Penicillium antarcticum]
METDLKLYGNELNYFTTFFNIGYMIMLYPSCIIISHAGPSIWLPACEVIHTYEVFYIECSDSLARLSGAY